MKDLKDWQHYPMGPALRRYLGLAETEQEQILNADINQHIVNKFCSYLTQEFRESPPETADEAEEIMAELIQMGLGEPVLTLAESCQSLGLHERFNGALLIGSAAMLSQRYQLAIDSLRRAQALEPQELAPYINMVQVLFHQNRDDECLKWAMSAFKIEPNSETIWEFVGGIYANRFAEGAGNELMRLAKKQASWAGQSLAAQYLAPEDPMFRAEVLEDLYSKGVRDTRFLVELTAALGVARSYDKIPTIVWQAEKMSEDRLPWQLYAHAAQAQFGLEKTVAAQAALAKALNHPDLPADVRDELRQMGRALSVEGDEVLH